MFVKKQIDLDLTPYIDDKNSTRKYLNINFKDIPKNKQNDLKQLSLSYDGKKFKIEDNGGLGMALMYGKESIKDEEQEESIKPGEYKTKGGETITVHSVKGNKATISGNDSKDKEIDLDALKHIIKIDEEESCDDEENKMEEGLRSVKVIYQDGTEIVTSMSGKLTDDEIRDYFKVGKRFNLGSAGKDKMVAIKQVKILENVESVSEEPLDFFESLNNVRESVVCEGFKKGDRVKISVPSSSDMSKYNRMRGVIITDIGDDFYTIKLSNGDGEFKKESLDFFESLNNIRESVLSEDLKVDSKYEDQLNDINVDFDKIGNKLIVDDSNKKVLDGHNIPYN